MASRLQFFPNQVTKQMKRNKPKENDQEEHLKAKQFPAVLEWQ